jgi:hypothetical protein
VALPLFFLDQEIQAPMLSSTCHCGAVRIDLPHPPQKLTNCNCSLCRRYGGLWAYYQMGEVTVTGHPAETEAYIWGDKTLQTIRCRHCGCVTHWEPLDERAGGRMGVNARMFDPAALGSVEIRCFDGADSWTFVDCF